MDDEKAAPPVAEAEVAEIADESPAPAIRTLGIPVLNRGDLLLRCVRSVDHPVGTLFLINNGQDAGVARALEQIQARDIPNAAMFSEVRVEKYRNLGCARSWNHVIRTSAGAWLISGNDIQFTPGDVGRVAAALAANPDASIVCAMGYAVFAFTEVGLKKVGLFDENFYPAYYEDNDHFRRVALTGAKAVGVPDFKAVHGEPPHWGSHTINSDPVLQRKNVTTFENLKAYYVRKWGGLPGQERFATPFGRKVPLDFWEFDPALRQQNSLF